MCIFEWTEVSLRAKCWLCLILMEGSEANCSYWLKDCCSYTSLISANLSDGHLLFMFEIISQGCMTSDDVCSGLTGALEKPAVSGGCWTAVLTWLLVYLQQCCWGQGFINLRAERRGLFSPLPALQLSCWPANVPLKTQPPKTPGMVGQDWMKMECWKCQADQSLPDWHDAWCAVLCLISN